MSLTTPNEPEKDLFKYPEELPVLVRKLVEDYGKIGPSLNDCHLLVDALKLHGYTCDFGWDAIPYGLRKIKPE